MQLAAFVVDTGGMPATRRRPTHAVVATDGLGRIRTWDAGAAAMFGRPLDEVVGRRIAEIVAADSASTLAHQVMQTTMRGEAWTGSLAVRQPVATDEAPVCQVAALPTIDDESRLLAVVWTFTDVRAQRRSEQALRRLSALVESSGDAVVSMTPDGIVTSCNAAAEELYGHKAGDIVGRPATLLAPPHRAVAIAQTMDAVRAGAPR